MKDRKIIWEKWIDPFGNDSLDMEWPGAFDIVEDDDGLMSFEDKYEEENEPSIKSGPKLAILNTPTGILPLTEHTIPSKIYNFWTMHTTFRITQSVVEALEKTDGIETLDVFTPYRCRISIGKAFDTKLVKELVQQNLGVTVLKDETRDQDM